MNYLSSAFGNVFKYSDFQILKALNPNLFFNLIHFLIVYFVVFLSSWNNGSIPRFRLDQRTVHVEGSSAAVLGSSQRPGFHRTPYQEGEGEGDPQSKTPNSP